MNQKVAYSSQYFNAGSRSTPYGVIQRSSTSKSDPASDPERSSFSLKSMIQAKKKLSQQMDNVIQHDPKPQKMLDHGTVSAIQQNFAYSSPLPMKWTPDKWDGRPCCFLPHTPERFRGVIPPDLRGMRIPSNGLPPFLQGISACGWTLELSGGELHLKQAHPAARNEAGCLGYMRIHAKNVAADWRLWREVVRI